MAEKELSTKELALIEERLKVRANLRRLLECRNTERVQQLTRTIKSYEDPEEPHSEAS